MAYVASTLSLYTMNVEEYVVPRIGTKLLQQLSPADINDDVRVPARARVAGESRCRRHR